MSVGINLWDLISVFYLKIILVFYENSWGPYFMPCWCANFDQLTGNVNKKYIYNKIIFISNNKKIINNKSL